MGEDRSDEQGAVWRTIESIHRAWLKGPLDELDALHHEQAVIVDRDFRRLAEGRKACVGSYHAYVAHAETLYFRALDPVVDVAGSTAVVSYRYEVGYRVGGDENHEAGWDLDVLTQRDGRWQVLWRQTHSAPVEQASPPVSF